MTNRLSGNYYNNYIKRIIDIFLSIFLIILFLPLSLVVALLIIIDSKGPVFADVPERIGEHGRKFKMFKFRSMIVQAHYLLRTDPKMKKLYEEYKKDSYKLKQDPRVTRVGRFIRKHSIDEIPQFINVLTGDMSIVGPRAYYPDELDNQIKKYPKVKPLLKKVLSVRPGITGLWQVSGRSEINFDKRITIDAQYIDHISLWNDLKIIIKTPLVMLNGRGAI